jgi:trans-aconitate methyltransferase
LADFVCAYLGYVGQPVRSVLDLGCGLGLWRGAIASHYPDARYRGVEFSEYLCDKYGWEQGSVVDFRTAEPADLVICQDTLQYLPPAEARAAIKNLARLSGAALYLSALTKKDWKENCDRSKTDSAVYKRSAQWYRDRLQRKFFNLGGGLFLRRDTSIVVWELETL